MKLLTLRRTNGTGNSKSTTAVRQDGDTLTEIPGFSDVGETVDLRQGVAVLADSPGAVSGAEGEESQLLLRPSM